MFRLLRLLGKRRGQGEALLKLAAVVAVVFLLAGGEVARALPYSTSVDLDIQAVRRGFRLSSVSLLEGASEFLTNLWKNLAGEWEEEPIVGRASPLSYIPPYEGDSYVWLDEDPDFTQEERQRPPYEYYGPLDLLGRCTVAEAMLDPSLMPATQREAIGAVKPTGWHTVKYDIIEDKYLYNRCHLIGYQLTGENANERNLITGTRYMNVRGMLGWENLLANYLKEVGGRCLYRVTPIFDGLNLVASGVHMEAESVEDDEIWFNIFVFNVQPGIGINYRNGSSWLE